MKKEYESPEMVIEYFDIFSDVCAPSGFGWEEEDNGDEDEF